MICFHQKRKPRALGGNVGKKSEHENFLLFNVLSLRAKTGEQKILVESKIYHMQGNVLT